MDQMAEEKSMNELSKELGEQLKAKTREADLELRFDFHRFLGFLVAAVLLILPASALATDYNIRLEPGVAIPLSEPQSDVYGIGGGVALRPFVGLTPYLDVGPSVSYTFMPASAPGAKVGVAWGFGGGLRFKRPTDRESFYGISPWLDADALYVRTGSLNRYGFDAGLGLAVPLGETRSYRVGPFVRYFQTLNGERSGYDTRDAKLLIAGISLEIGSTK